MPINVLFDIGKTLVRDSAWLPGSRACIDTLRLQGVRLGIISNTGSMTRSELAALLPDDFDFGQVHSSIVLLSSEVGLEKPDPRIFLHAIDASASAPQECVFVGEDLEETWVAQAVGIRAIRVAHFPYDFDKIDRLLRTELLQDS